MKNTLKELYLKIGNASNDNRFKSDTYYCIIQIKINKQEYLNYYQGLYKDIKLFITFHIRSLDDLDYGYDCFNRQKINKCLDYLESYEERYEICLFLKRQLNHFEIEEEAKYFHKIAHQNETKILKKNKRYFKYLLNLSTNSFMNIMLTILLIIVINIIIFLPAPINSFEIIKIEYENYSDSFILNHYTNVLCNIFGLTSNFKVSPNSLSGIILLGVIKIIYATILINYLYKKFIDLIK